MLHPLNVCKILALLDLTAPKVAAGKKNMLPLKEIEIIFMMKVDVRISQREVVTNEMGHTVYSFGGVLTDPTKHLAQTHKL